MNPSPRPTQPWFALHPHRFLLGESPRAAHGQLRWLDIEARTLHCAQAQDLSLHTKHVLPYTTRTLPDQIACVLPTTDPTCWIGFGRNGVWALSDDGTDQKLLDAPFDSTRIRFNDACCDEWGRIWVASLVDDKQSADGALYCFEKGKLHVALTGLTTGNGLAYSARHNKLWLADTTARYIRNFFISEDSIHLRPAGLHYRYTHHTERPDGACMLTAAQYAVAVIDGYRIDVFDTGTDTLKHSIHAPFNKVTMPCVVSGRQDFLVLTSAKTDVPINTLEDAEQTLQTGCLLAKPLEQGLAETHVYRF